MYNSVTDRVSLSVVERQTVGISIITTLVRSVSLPSSIVNTKNVGLSFVVFTVHLSRLPRGECINFYSRRTLLSSTTFSRRRKRPTYRIRTTFKTDGTIFTSREIVSRDTCLQCVGNVIRLLRLL